MISIRRMADTENGLAIVFYFTLTCIVVGALSLPFAARLPIDALDAALMVAAGLFGGLGQVFQTRAYAQAPASLVASLDYTALIFALAIGWAVWGETMSPLELLGAAIVIADGDLTPSRVELEAERMILDAANAAAMSRAAATVGIPDGAARLADLIEGVAT